MAESTSDAVTECPQPDAFALADQPVEKVTFRKIFREQQQEISGTGEQIVIVGLMNCLEIGLFYLYHGGTDIWGTIAAVIAWGALSWPNSVILEGFFAMFAYRSRHQEWRKAIRHRQEMADLRQVIERNHYRIPMELLESVGPSQAMRDACCHIQNLLDALVPITDRIEVSVESIATIRRIRTEYLPELLRNYIALPQDLRERPMLANGRTPEDASVEQAEWIIATLQRIRMEYYHRKADRIDASGQFLKSHLPLAGESTEEQAANDNLVTTRVPGGQE